jgi:hypothetical protein
VAARVRTVQDFVEVPVVLENASSYLDYTASAMPEWEFIRRLCQEADCGLLLDVNNVFVNAHNHGYDPRIYIDAIPIERIVYHHLAGHTRMGAWIKDTHSTSVNEMVWKLFRYVQGRTGGRTTVIEWDGAPPSFDTLRKEVAKAHRHASHPLGEADRRHRSVAPALPVPQPAVLQDIQNWFLDYIVQPQGPRDATAFVRPAEQLSSQQRADIYREQYWSRLAVEMEYYFPHVLRFLGKPAFGAVVRAYAAAHPPDHYNVLRLRDRFPAFLQDTWMSDVARLEKAVRDSADAPGVQSVSDVRPGCRVIFVPSLRLLKLRHDVEDWVTGGQTPLRGPAPTYLMVFRQGFGVQRRRLSQSMYRMMRLLQRGISVERATQRVGAEAQSGVAELVGQGLVARVQPT